MKNKLPDFCKVTIFVVGDFLFEILRLDLILIHNLTHHILKLKPFETTDNIEFHLKFTPNKLEISLKKVLKMFFFS